MLEADTVELKTKATRMTEVPESATAMSAVVQMGGIAAAPVEAVPALWRAPIARMY